MKRFLRRLVLWGLGASFLASAGFAGLYKLEVVDNPGPAFQHDAILSIIAQESPVFYRDAVTPMGVFFDHEHRQYVPFAELPDDWIKAIVAAEDGNFFSHLGVDPKHVARAMWQNLRAGTVVAGGSTLTQQTAKNLFYRPDRSLRSKGVEFLNALRLEAHFSKEDILEFYANQFHVSANGRGIGVAARYFFDKSPAALSTKECAFIAGMVKAPSRYNPFIGQSEERRAAARTFAEDRTSYVLRRMVVTGALPAARADELMATPLEFRRGTFRYDRSIVLDEVQRRLEEPEFIELFERLGIDNPSTAGLQIVTTVDAPTQRAATYGLWHHLAELGPQIERPKIEQLILAAPTAVESSPNVPLEWGTFYQARVVGPVDDGLAVDVAGRACTVDAAGIKRIAKAFGVDSEVLRAALPASSAVLVSLRPPYAEVPGCDLEFRPQLQGASLVLEDGLVRAMVGGNDNRNFNRVSTAERQFGSTWKPIIYLAAIQLGWLPTDILDNRRAVFPMRGVWYYPSPDHASDPYLSMSAAGTRSENVASVWLLAHLIDRLNDDQLRHVAQSVDLLPRAGEEQADFARRMRDEAVIGASAERMDEFAFTRAKEDVIGGLGMTSFPGDAVAVRSLLYGYGAAAETARLRRTASSAEREVRLAAVAQNFLALEQTGLACLSESASKLTWDPASEALACGRPPAGFVPLPAEAIAELGMLRVDATLSLEQQAALVVDSRVHLGTLQALRAALDKHRTELSERDPADPEIVMLNPDWRALVGVRYIHALAASVGITAKLPDNLTLPLGAADASLGELALAYQGMLGEGRPHFVGKGFEAGAVPGMRSTFGLGKSDEPTALIQEIRDAGGNVIFRLASETAEGADTRAGEMVGDILRNVVLHGTGRRAAAFAVPPATLPLALAGKTGTTNDYRNAAFIGFVPISRAGESGPPRWGSALTVATYVGYDDNRSMRRGSLRVQGANGALPAWLEAVRGMAHAGVLGGTSGGEYVAGVGLERVEGAAQTGLPGSGMSTLTIAGTPPERLFAPLGQVAAGVVAQVDPAPVGAVGLPTDVEFGPPEPEEGVDPTIAPVILIEIESTPTTIPELEGGFELPG